MYIQNLLILWSNYNYSLNLLIRTFLAPSGTNLRPRNRTHQWRHLRRNHWVHEMRVPNDRACFHWRNPSGCRSVKNNRSINRGYFSCSACSISRAAVGRGCCGVNRNRNSLVKAWRSIIRWANSCSPANRAWSKGVWCFILKVFKLAQRSTNAPVKS